MTEHHHFYKSQFNSFARFKTNYVKNVVKRDSNEMFSNMLIDYYCVFSQSAPSG